MNLCESNEDWNANFVLHELALYSNKIWEKLRRAETRSSTSSSDTVELLQSLPKSFNDIVHTILDNMTTMAAARVEAAPQVDIPMNMNGGDDHAPEREDWELVMDYEWRLLELEFMTQLTQQLDRLTKEVEEKSFAYETYVFPDSASATTTKKHLEKTEADISELEEAITKEKIRRNKLEVEYTSASLKCGRLALGISGLAVYAIDSILSPANMDFSGQDFKATFNHVVGGMQTHHINPMDGSSTKNLIEINNDNSNDDEGSVNLASINRGHIAADFHRALCTSNLNGCVVLQKALEPPVDADLNEVISHLSVVMGRIDMVALGLDELAKLYKVRIKTHIEGIEVMVDLPRKTLIRAIYHRKDPLSVYLSRPSQFIIEQGGQQLNDSDLIVMAQNLSKSSSLEVSARGLSFLCDAVLTKLADETPN